MYNFKIDFLTFHATNGPLKYTLASLQNALKLGGSLDGKMN
jgi:hypothetical protein